MPSVVLTGEPIVWRWLINQTRRTKVVSQCAGASAHHIFTASLLVGRLLRCRYGLLSHGRGIGVSPVT